MRDCRPARWLAWCQLQSIIGHIAPPTTTADRPSSHLGRHVWRAGHLAALALPGKLSVKGCAPYSLGGSAANTLVIAQCDAHCTEVLPPTSASLLGPLKGGQLRVLHNGQETRVDLAARNAKSSCFAAFFSGEHCR